MVLKLLHEEMAIPKNVKNKKCLNMIAGDFK
jgi:hypothetical protein